MVRRIATDNTAFKLESTDQRRVVWRRFSRHKLALIGLGTVLVLVFLAVFAPWVARRDPYATDFLSIKAPPSGAHILGTDSTGRDVFSRLLFAIRVSLSVGLVSVSIYLTLGTFLGLVAGFYGGPLDSLIMRLADMVLCFPALMIIITMVSLLGPSIYNVMIAIGLFGWPPISRLVRAEVLSLKQRDFVVAARMIGATDRRLVFLHILPNVLAPITVAGTFGMATAILWEAGLSFLGLGVQPPTASWGNMLTAAQSLTILESMPWLWLPPGLAIAISVLSINFIGDGLRDAFDPRMKIM